MEKDITVYGLFNKCTCQCPFVFRVLQVIKNSFWLLLETCLFGAVLLYTTVRMIVTHARANVLVYISRSRAHQSIHVPTSFRLQRLLGSEGPAKVGRVAVLKYMYTNYAIGENAGCERRHIRVALDAATA